MSNPFQLDDDFKSVLDALVDHQRTRLFQSQDRRARKRRAQAAGEEFSLGRAIQEMAAGALGGPDREFLERCALLSGTSFDPQRVFLPWELLNGKRDLTAATASAAGYLVGTSVGAAADVLRGWSVAVNAGVTVLNELRENITIPRVTTPPTAYAIPSEGTPITESTPVIGSVALQLKNLAVFCEFSRQLLLQSNATEFVRMIMLTALGKFLDAQLLNGSGASGELLGLFNTAGVQTQSGTSLAHSGVTTMKKLASEAGARDEDIAFVSTPAVRQTLEVREKAAGNGGFIWQAGTVADRPAFASVECPTASMVAGPWPQVILAQWGPPGLVLEINPYEATNFRSSMLQARMVLSCDMGVIRPSAFVKSTTIT